MPQFLKKKKLSRHNNFYDYPYTTFGKSFSFH